MKKSTQKSKLIILKVSTNRIMNFSWFTALHRLTASFVSEVIYIGTTSRSLYQRGKEHLSGFLKKDDNNALYKHSQDKHDGDFVEFEMEETHNNHIKFPEKPPSISNINSNQQNGKDTKDAKNYDFNPQISMEEYKYTPEFDVEDCTVPIKNPFEDNSSESSHESQNSQDSIEEGSKMVSSKTPTSTLKRELDKERPVSSCKSWYSQYSQGKNKGVLKIFCLINQKSNS